MKLIQRIYKWATLLVGLFEQRKRSVDSAMVFSAQ